MKTTALVLALSPLLPISTRAQEGASGGSALETLDALREQALELLWGLHAEHEFPGASAALVLADGTLVELPVGFADPVTEREMRASDRLLSGSIGKTYVVASLLRLVEEGKVDLDRRAIEFFPDDAWFARLPNGEAITVRQLLRHQTGIPRHIFQPGFLDEVLGDPERVWTPKELLETVFDVEPLFAPGEGWSYADTNYIVLGMLVERVTGEPFYAYAKRTLLEPLGLADTVPSDTRRIAHLAQGTVALFRMPGVPEHTLADGEFFCNPQFEWCGGGWASTAGDLARWAHALYGGDVLGGEVRAAMLDTVPSNLGPGIGYGLGVMVRDTALGPQVGHDGVMFGYTGTMAYFPEHGISVALLLNTDDGRVLGESLDDVALRLVELAVASTGAGVER